MDNDLEALTKRVIALEEWVLETERGLATLPDALRKAFEDDSAVSGSPKS